MTAIAFDCQHKSVSTRKDRARSHSNATERIITKQMQADDAINVLHSSLFDHWLSSTDPFFGWLEDKFHIAGQFSAAFI